MTVRTRPRGGAPQASPNNHNRGQAASRTRGAAWLLTFLAVLGSLHAAFLIGAELFRGEQLRRSIQTLESDVAVLDADIAGLEAVIAHAGDLRYREQLARKQGYVYPHETLLIPRSP